MDKDISQDNSKQDKIYWHDAFYAALQLELYDYKDVLTFEEEHQLSKEALKMDVLIIKKTADVEIGKNIGRIFRNNNIFEYKSEKDNLSIWDYNKVTGYAMIYSAFEEIPIEDITISFVVTPKPIKLFDHLVNDRGFEVEEVSNGIYYVKGDTFKAQIIESKRLTAEENVFLKNLRSSLTKMDMQEVFEAFSQYGSLGKENPYLDRVLDANQSIFEEVISMTSVAVRNIILKQFEKDGTLDSIREDKAKETALKMLRKGYAPAEVADNVEMPIEWVQSLKK
ncbi:MAG: 3-isopropylmalate dehydrogenase [Defluviitaleaceae bacterium]|nr:3-isopropylmalate dehydrogenase [Defluviitaleaceae bacterium]